jgi:Zn-dependent peptidase ImmA (M78 family)
MHKLARRIRARQEAAAELIELLEDNTPWRRSAGRFRGVEPGRLATIARDLLAITVKQQMTWQDPSGYKPLRSWVDAVEALGILVMQDGHMPPETMRGFASPHERAPAIVINTKDNPRARVFTAIHELGHLAWALSGAPGAGSEAWCNQFAGDVLMPASDFRAQFLAAGALERQARVHRLALLFGVTPFAAAVRIARLGLLPGDAGNHLVDEIKGRPAPAHDPGGNFYLNKVAWLGPTFIRLVLEAVDEQAVTLSNAAGLLGAKVSQFDRLRQTVDSRAGSG